MITLHHNDAFKVFKSIPSNSIDLIITDPPWKDYKSNIRKKDVYKKINTSGEVHTWVNKFAQECYRVLKNNSHMYCFIDSVYYPMFYAAFKYADESNYLKKHWEGCAPDYDKEEFSEALDPKSPAIGFHIKKLLYWQKPNHTVGDLKGDYGERMEPILFMHKGVRKLYGKRRSNTLVYDRTPAHLIHHPTQKPIDLLEVFIQKSSDPGDLILDPFAGMCTTGQAAEELGRHSIMIEIEEEYFKKSRFLLQKMDYNFKCFEGGE